MAVRWITFTILFLFVGRVVTFAGRNFSHEPSSLQASVALCHQLQMATASVEKSSVNAAETENHFRTRRVDESNHLRSITLSVVALTPIYFMMTDRLHLDHPQFPSIIFTIPTPPPAV
jgi:hypothetical protein